MKKKSVLPCLAHSGGGQETTLYLRVASEDAHYLYDILSLPPKANPKVGHPLSVPQCHGYRPLKSTLRQGHLPGFYQRCNFSYFFFKDFLLPNEFGPNKCFPYDIIQSPNIAPAPLSIIVCCQRLRFSVRGGGLITAPFLLLPSRFCTPGPAYSDEGP